MIYHVASNKLRWKPRCLRVKSQVPLSLPSCLRIKSQVLLFYLFVSLYIYMLVFIFTFIYIYILCVSCVFIEIHISILISSPLTSTHVWRLYLIHDWFLWIHFGSWWDFPISLGHDVCWNAGYIPMLSWFNYVFADQVSIWSFSNTNFQILVVWILMLAASAWLPIRSFHGLTFTDSRSAI